MERWRADVAKLLPESLRSRPDAPLLVDKALHVIDGESKGDPSVVGDGGVAHGLFQSHYVGANASPEQQIADAWSLVLKNPDQWTDWGEGATYKGKPFGALGNYPYANGTPEQQQASGVTPGSGPVATLAGSSIRPPDTGSAGLADTAEMVSRNRMSAQAARDAVEQEQTRAQLETTLGIPGFALSHEEDARYSHGPDPVLPPQDAMAPTTDPALQPAVDTQPPPDNTPTPPPAPSWLQEDSTSRIVAPTEQADTSPYGQIAAGEAGQQPDVTAGYIPTDAAIAKAELASKVAQIDKVLGREGPDVLGALGTVERNTRIADIPYAPQVANVVGRLVDASGATAPLNEGLGLTNEALNLAGLGRPLPSAGDIARTAVPTNVRDAALTVLPLAGEARGALEAKALEGVPETVGRAVDSAGVRAVSGQAGGTPIMRGAEDLATVEGAAMSPVEMYQKARGMGMDDDAIAAAFGQSAVDAGRGVDTAAQGEALRQASNDAAAHAAKRVFNSVVDATGDVDQAAQEARKAAAAAQDTIAGAQKPNVLAEADTAQQMREAMARSRGGTVVDLAPDATGGGGRRILMPDKGAPADPFEGLTSGEGAAAGETATETVGGGQTITASPDGTPAVATSTTGPTEVTTTKGSGVPGVPAPAPLPKGAKPAETIAHRAAREIIDLVNAPISLVTYGHEPVFRQGIGFALSHPSTAQEAVGNLVKVAKDPSAFTAINDALNQGRFTKAAMDAGWLKEGAAPNPTFVRQVLNKIPGMANSRDSARIYLTTLRKAGYESEAARLFASGERNPDQYKALWDTISDVTGHGLRGQSLAVGGINPVFSPQAMLGRFRSLTDVFFPEAGLAGGAPNLVGVGARNVAIKNLLAIGGLTLGVDGIAKAAGLDLKWDLLKTPLGKVSVGVGSTIDPTAGMGSIARFGAKVVDAASSHDWSGIREATSSFINGQLGPVSGTIASTFTGQDWQGRDFNLLNRVMENPTKSGSLARDLLVPIAANSIIDAVKANGSIGALIAAPSLGAMSVETNLLQAARDKAVQALPEADRQFNGKVASTYADAGPAVRAKVDATPSVVDAKGAPSNYQQAKAERSAPIDAEQKQYEDAFNQGNLTRPITDWWHDTSLKRQQAATDLSSQFADQFKGFDKTKYDSAIEGYFGRQVKNSDGSMDFDATESSRQDYLKTLPADEQQWVNESLQLSKDKQTPLRQQYLDYLDAKKKAGYFDVPPGSPDAAAKKKALDTANPQLDAQAWYFSGGQVGADGKSKSGGQLNTKAAVDDALNIIDKDGLSGRTVHFLGADRDLATPEGRRFWADNGDLLNRFYDDANIIAKNKAPLDYDAKQRYQTTFDKATPSQQQSLLSSVRTNDILVGNPKLDALHAYAGFGGDSQKQEYLVHSNAALEEVKKLIATYGNTRPKPGWKYNTTANAR